MGKKKQPYIPVYIGDWEQDTNCLSIEAEGAWLKVVFKCWKNNGTFITTRESLARLCKVSLEKFASLLLEWKLNDICDIIEAESGIIQITSRRLKREFEISQIRSHSGSKGGSKTQANSKAKDQAKVKQKPDIDIDNEIDIENTKKESPNFASPDIRGDEIILPFETEPMRKLWAAWKEARWLNHGVMYAMHGEQADLRRLQNMTFQQVEETIQQAIAYKWKNLYPEKNGTRQNTTRKNSKQQQSDATTEYLREHYNQKLDGK